MGNFFDFSSDQINVFMMAVDESGSMRDHVEEMKRGEAAYKKSFEGFPEANSIAISKSHFSTDLDLQYFRPLDEFDNHYSPGGYTALYYAIVRCSKALLDYMAEIAQKKGITPGGTFIVLSDGKPEYDQDTWENAKAAIERLNEAGVTTVFVAFGDAISSEFGKKLGFSATRDVDDLQYFLGVELSQSCKEQSKSRKSLGANFFSQANQSSSSENYSATTNQALEDQDWFEDI